MSSYDIDDPLHPINYFVGGRYGLPQPGKVRRYALVSMKMNADTIHDKNAIQREIVSNMEKNPLRWATSFIRNEFRGTPACARAREIASWCMTHYFDVSISTPHDNQVYVIGTIYVPIQE